MNRPAKPVRGVTDRPIRTKPVVTPPAAPATPPAPPIDPVSVAAAALEILRRGVASSGDDPLMRAVREFREAVEKDARSREITARIGDIGKAATEKPAELPDVKDKDAGKPWSVTDFRAALEAAMSAEATGMGTRRAGSLAADIETPGGAAAKDAPDIGGDKTPSMLARLEQSLASGIGGALAKTGDMVLMRFQTMLGPLAILGQLLSSNAAGFQLLSGVMKVLVATIAPILLPIIVAVSAALLELSDRLWQDIEPVLEEWYTIIFESVLPALRQLVDAIMWVVETTGAVVGTVHETAEPIVEGINDFLDWVKPGLSGREEAAPAGTGAPVDTGAGTLTKDTGGAAFFDGDIGGVATTGVAAAADGATAVGDSAAGSPTVGDVATGKAEPGDRGDGGAMSSVIKELRMSMGPRAQFSGLAQVSRNVQMQALNQSPLEAKMLERMTKSLDVLERVEMNTRPRPTGVTH